MRKRTLLLSITVACIAAFGWVRIRRGFRARDNPYAIETLIATTARQLAVRSQYCQLTLRPKIMTVSTVVAGLLPIMWSTRTGAEVMKPLRTPVLAGMSALCCMC